MGLPEISVKEQVLVSLVVAIYNALEYLEATLQSVLCQSYFNWEMILFNNGSMDNKSNMITRFSSSDKRVTAISLDSNSGGPAVARSIGSEKSRGGYGSFLHADDVWDRNKLEKQMSSISYIGLFV